MKLNPKQIKFCQLYHQTGNATRSYIDAGYQVKNEKVASVMVTRLLANDSIQKCLEGLKKASSEKMNITTERLMAEAAKIAFSDLNEIVEVVDGELVLKPCEDLNQLDGISASKTESESQTYGKNGDSSSTSKSTSFSIKRSDRLKALDMLARMIGAYDRRESDNSKVIRDAAPRVLESLRKYREQAKKPGSEPGEIDK